MIRRCTAAIVVSAFAFAVFIGGGTLQSAAAQVPFEEGYVLRAPGDTLRGEIRYEKWVRTPETIQFRPSPSADVQTISVRDAVGFRVREYAYERHVVDVDQRATSLKDVTPKQGETRRDTVFLRRLVSGPLTLYAYRTDRRKHFYVQTGQQTPEELVYYVQAVDRGGQTFATKTREYRFQLARMRTPQCEERSTRDLDYTAPALIRFIRACNGREGEVAQDTEKQVGVRLRHAVDGSGSVTTVTHNDVPFPYTGMRGGQAGAGYTLLISRDRPSPKGALRLRVGLNRFATSGTGENTRRQAVVIGGERRFRVYTVRQWTMRAVWVDAEIGVRYRFTRDRIRPFVDGGLFAQIPLSYSGDAGGSTALYAAEQAGTAYVQGEKLRDRDRSYTLDAWTGAQPGASVGVGVEWGNLSAKVGGALAFPLQGTLARAPGLTRFTLTVAYQL